MKTLTENKTFFYVSKYSRIYLMSVHQVRALGYSTMRKEKGKEGRKGRGREGGRRHTCIVSYIHELPGHQRACGYLLPIATVSVLAGDSGTPEDSGNSEVASC